ncbi:helix-turn-helix transcriptional regulator [Thioclava nitratireducens]|uniref:helix-turn-helix transcriptional regulator n=1 Tax=Thioclava nitratireducens TaxID=1915078 RepID=UPI00248179F2|nr:response regulator transcription factor [Thioclava nitratireducens]WGT50411.1 response regulator transcription factor [Thioclava nitratireducens]
MNNFTNATETPRVLFIDDNAILADTVEKSFAADGNIAVVSQCKDLPSALTAQDVPMKSCDLVLFDPSQSPAAPADTLSAVREAAGPVAAIAYLPETALEIARQCLQSDYDGIISRSRNTEMLIDAVLSVSMGGLYVDGCYADVRAGSSKPFLVGTEILTDREREVVRGIVEGKSCRAIGDDLSISGKTVETHKYRALSKMGLACVRDLETFARRNAWGGLTGFSRRCEA